MSAQKEAPRWLGAATSEADELGKFDASESIEQYIDAQQFPILSRHWFGLAVPS